MIDFAILALRLTLCVVMIAHGIIKFRKKREFDKKWQDDYGFPVGSVVLNGIVQVTCGLAIGVGFFSRYAAAILALNMLVATYVSIWKHHQAFLSSSETKGWDLNFLLIGSLIALLFMGDGRWSIAEWLT
jgi:putative oxidoreductase